MSTTSLPAPDPAELADRLGGARDRIVRRWLVTVRAEGRYPDVGDEAVLDNTPALLDALVHDLQHAGEGPPALLVPAREHGDQRASLGVSIGTLLHEYDLLLDAILDELAGTGRPADRAETRLLRRVLRVAVQASLEQQAQERRELLYRLEQRTAQLQADVEARRRAEAEAHASSERLRAVLDNAIDAVITIDHRGTILDVNPATTRMFGWTREELLGRDVSVLMPEPDRSRHPGYLRRYLRTGVPHVIGFGREVTGLHKDGSPIELDLAVTAFDIGGKQFFVGSLRDISARKGFERRQALLVEAAEVLAGSLDLRETLDGVAALLAERLVDYCVVDLADENGRVGVVAGRARSPEHQRALDAVLRQDGPPEDSLLARSVAEREVVVIPELDGSFLEPLLRTPALRRAAEVLAPRSAALLPLRARGRDLGLLVLGSRDRDGFAAPGLLDLARTLADRAALAIDNARLYDAVQAEVRHREELLSVVGHDLRNPLQAIEMSAAVLARQPDLDPRVARTAERILAAGGRARRLIADLLDVSRVRAGSFAVNPEPARAHALVARVVDEIRAAHPDRVVALVAVGDDAVELDEGRVSQVVANLVTNALQHGDPSTKVRVRCEGTADTYLVSVHNEGAPLPPDVLPALFEPWRRGEQTGGEGLGLGLFIARSVARAHGGDLVATSAEGEGTTFTLCLPRR